MASAEVAASLAIAAIKAGNIPGLYKDASGKEVCSTHTLGPAVLITSSALEGIAILVVMTRLYTRTFLSKNLGLDDYLMAMALVRSSLDRFR
jgi:hypothetical protein